MGTNLRVLVFGSEQSAADAVIPQLEAAGHDVLRCHEPGAAAFPCVGLTDVHACPARQRVDVALTVRRRPRSQPSPLEDGVSCALQRHVPLVVAGSTALNPFEDWAAEVVEPDDDLLGAIERAARAPLPRHGERATLATLDVLEKHAAARNGVRAEVRRSEGRLRVRVLGAQGLEHPVRDMAAVRIIGALRELDPDAGGIDVAFED